MIKQALERPLYIMKAQGKMERREHFLRHASYGRCTQWFEVEEIANGQYAFTVGDKRSMRCGQVACL